MKMKNVSFILTLKPKEIFAKPKYQLNLSNAFVLS